MDFFGGSAMALTVDGFSLRMLVFSGKKIESWHSVPLNPSWVKDGLVSAPEKVGKAMEEAVKEKNLPRSGVLAALCSTGAASQTLALPKIKGSKLEGTVLREVKRLMPGSVDADYIYWQPLPENGNKQKQSIYALAIPKGNIINMMEVCRTAGIKMKALELKPFALARAVNCKTGIIANCEVDNIEIVVVDRSFPALFRSIPVKEASPTPDLACQNLIRELPFTVDYYNRSHSDSTVSSETPVYLSGGLALDPGIAPKLTQATGRKVSAIEPPLDFPQNFPLEQYLVNVGLMLKGKW